MFKKYAVWVFFLATFAVSWLIWVSAIVSTRDTPNLALVVIGAFVPSAMGVVFTYLTQDRQGRRQFWQRVIDVRRIRRPWLAVILLMSPLTIVVAALLFTLLGGTLPAMTETLQRFASPALLAELLMADLLVGAVSEELGWRGYALDQLQRKWGATIASLVLGILWAVWHTPTFLIPGITQGEMGLFSLDYLLFLAMVVALSVLTTWVYNNTQRSTLAAILLHFVGNLSLDLIAGLQGAMPQGYNLVHALLCVLLAIGVIAKWGPKTLTGKEDQASFPAPAVTA